MRQTKMPMRATFLIAAAVMSAAVWAAPSIEDAFRPGNPVTDVNPYPVKLAAPLRSLTTPTGGTIAAANVYQSALAADGFRRGCALQNRSAVRMRVFIGTPAAATDASAFDLEPGDTFSCSSGSMVVTDQISVASSAAGSAFTVARQ